MKVVTKAALGFTMAIALSGVASAGMINGSLALSGFGVLGFGGTNLSDFTSITTSSDVATSTGAGDYSTVLVGTSFTDNGLDPSNLGAFILSGTSFVFTAQSSGSFIETRTATALVVYLLGTVTGLDGTTCGSPCDPSLSSITLAFSQAQNGSQIGDGMALSTPPGPAVPEPATAALFGTALVALGFFRRRKV